MCQVNVFWIVRELAMKLIWILTVFLFSGCSQIRISGEIINGKTNYQNYFNIQCFDYVLEVCIDGKLSFSDNEITELIRESDLGNKDANDISAIRNNLYHSNIEQTKVLSIVFGSYSTVNGNNWDATEEILSFRFNNGEWIKLDTSVLLIEPNI